jgi:hypothetical protein
MSGRLTVSRAVAAAQHTPPDRQVATGREMSGAPSDAPQAVRSETSESGRARARRTVPRIRAMSQDRRAEAPPENRG